MFAANRISKRYLTVIKVSKDNILVF